MIRGYSVWDTHSHIVPGVDDGARTINEALEMLRMEAMQGVDFVFATPHSRAFDENGAYVLEKYEELRQAKEDARINSIDLIGLGCEMLCHTGNIVECLKKIDAGIYPTFGRRVLVEFPTYGFGIKDATYCVEKFRSVGYMPVIAHAERYEFSDVMSIGILREKGAEIQINAYSLSCDHSLARRRLAADLVKFGFVNYMGSDAHRLDHRPPVVEDGVKRLIELTSREQGQIILGGGPKENLIALYN